MYHTAGNFDGIKFVNLMNHQAFSSLKFVFNYVKLTLDAKIKLDHSLKFDPKFSRKHIVMCLSA